MNTENEIKPAAPAEGLDSGRCAVDALLGPNVDSETVWACGHKGFPSIYPTPEGAVECTACANKRRGFQS